jgi:hypothetical protein
MPRSVPASGTQACTVGTRHVLTAGTGPTGGGNYVLVLDVSALTPGQFLEVEVLRPTLTGGTAQLYTGAPVTLGAGQGWCDSPLFGVPSGVAYEVAIRQVGAAGGRSIPWSLERVDA